MLFVDLIVFVVFVESVFFGFKVFGLFDKDIMIVVKFEVLGLLDVLEVDKIG